MLYTLALTCFFSTGARGLWPHPDHCWGQRGHCAHWDHQEFCSSRQFGRRVCADHTGDCWTRLSVMNRDRSKACGWFTAGSHGWALGSGRSPLQTPLPHLWVRQAGVSVGLQLPSAHLGQEPGGESVLPPGVSHVYYTEKTWAVCLWEKTST